jgi:hypothetical protein
MLSAAIGKRAIQSGTSIPPSPALFSQSTSKSLCRAISYTASEIGVARTNATSTVKTNAAAPEGPLRNRLANPM